MTDTSPDFQAYEARLAAGRALAAEQAPVNRASLFNALAAAGIHTVVVTFDGSGDEGQIESIDAFGTDNAVLTLPAEPVAFGVAAFDGSHIEHSTSAIREVIEAMAYDFLEQTHAGWEDGDGAYGEFTFTVAGRLIGLDHNERRMASDYSRHDL